MINLIPKTEKKRKIRDFYLRLLTVFFTMLGLSFLFAALVLVPAHIGAYYGGKSLRTNMELATNYTLTEDEKVALDLIDELDQKLAILESAKKGKYIFSERVVNDLVLKKGENIEITAIVYQKDDLGLRNIDVGGTAMTRDALLSFRQTLENNPSFSKVDLPISNFVRGSNIRFSLRLVPTDITP